MADYNSIERLLILCTAMLFGVFGSEAFLGHTFKLNSGIWYVYIPLFFSAAALLISALTFARFQEKIIKVYQITMLLSLVVAIAGFYFHLNMGWSGNFLVSPAAAPLSYIIPALLGLAATRKRGLRRFKGTFKEGNSKLQSSPGTWDGIDKERAV